MNKHIHSTSLLVLVSFLLFITISCKKDVNNGNTDQLTTTSIDGIDFKNKDNTVYIRLPAEPDRLNPTLTTNGYSRYVFANVFQELLSFDPVTLKEVPILAKSRPQVEITKEGVNYTYELFDNATWSDGQPVTAQDVLFSLKAVFNLNVTQAAPYRPGFFFVTDVIADPTNNKKFTVYTNEPYFLAETSINGTSILPAHIFDPNNLMGKYSLADMINNGEELAEEADMKAFAELFTSAPYSRDGDKLIGSGAYQVKSWEEGLSITLAKIDNWWAESGHPHTAAYPDSLVFRVIIDPATSINALKDELIDVSVQVDASDFVDLQTNEFVSEHYNFHTPDSYIYFYIAFNNDHPKLEDKRVRRAFAHLVDLDFLINEEYHGLATRMNNTPVLPSKSYFDSNLKEINLDIEKAKTLLSEAGWQDSNNNGTVDKEIDGELIEMELDYFISPGSKFGKIMAELIQDNAIQAGVQINIIPRNFRTVLEEDVRPRTYHIFTLAASGYPVPDDFNQLWHTSSNTPRGSNRVQFGNAESDAIIDKIRITLDEDKRADLYKQFQKIIYDEQPMVFLFAPKERIIISKRFDATTTSLRPGFRPASFKHLQ